MLVPVLDDMEARGFSLSFDTTGVGGGGATTVTVAVAETHVAAGVPDRERRVVRARPRERVGDVRPIPVAPSSKAHVSVTGTDGSLLQPTPWNVTPAPVATRLADVLAFAVGVGSLNS